MQQRQIAKFIHKLPFTSLLIGFSLIGVSLTGCDRLADAQSQQVPNSAMPSPVPTGLTSDRDVPYVPTPQAVVDAMLEVAKVGKDDLLYDLGSGDGRIVITAAQKFGTRGVGIDIDPERVQEAQANARQAGVTRSS
jgi:SAM-dependent methyltransferase